MTKTKFINKCKNLDNEQKSKLFTFGVVLPLCIWGVLTILSIPTLALHFVGGFLFFGILGWIFEKKKRMENIITTLLNIWMVITYVAIFTGMGYLACYWLSAISSINPTMGAFGGFILGVITVTLLIRKILKYKKS